MKQNFASRSVYIFFSLSALVVTLGCLARQEFLYLFVFLAAAVAAYAAGKLDISPAVFMCALTGVSFVLKLMFVLNADTQPVSDFAAMYDAARAVAAGDYGTVNGNAYFQDWAYQTGYVIFMSFFIRFFGAGVTFFKVLNCVFLTATNVFVYLFARRFASEHASRAAGIAYMLYPGVYFLAPVLTNQHLGNALVFAALFLFTANKKTAAAPVVTGVLLALGDAARPVAAVVLAALILVEGVRVVIERKARGTLQRVFALAVMLASFFAVSLALSQAVKLSGINENGLANGFPLWKLVLGLNHETGGLYSNEDTAGIYAVSDLAERNEKAVAAIRERLSVPPLKMFALFGKKINGMWLINDSLTWAFPQTGAGVRASGIGAGGSRNGDFLERAQKMGGAVYFGVFLFALYFSVSMVRTSRVFETALVLCAVFSIYFGIHLIIEVQVRYRDFAMIPVFALAAGGVDVFERAWERFNRRYI